jgi:hypothetical protein
MSHRPEDIYAYVATRDINIGGVKAFSKGDPVPDGTAEVLKDQEDHADAVCLREDWEDRPEDEPSRPMVRGEMPEHLRKPDVPEQKESPKPPTGRSKSTSSKSDESK